MYEILMVIYLVVALALVGFILIQQGKGAGMGSAFGSGASGTVFGASGSGNFLTKSTTILAIVFFGVALGLGNITSESGTTTEDNLLFDSIETEQPAAELPIEAQEIPEESTELPVVEGSISDDLPTEEISTDEAVKKSEKSTEEKDSDSQ